MELIVDLGVRLGSVGFVISHVGRGVLLEILSLTCYAIFVCSAEGD